jgi:hypothetical protein
MRLVAGDVLVDDSAVPALGAVRVRLERIGNATAPLPIFGRGLRDHEEIPRGWAPHDVSRKERS